VTTGAVVTGQGAVTTSVDGARHRPAHTHAQSPRETEQHRESHDTAHKDTQRTDQSAEALRGAIYMKQGARVAAIARTVV
jgi:hypothetical protein